MALTDLIPRALLALENARLEEGARIAESVQISRVVGVLGEAEVGKTETIRQALGHSTSDLSVVRLDLDGAAGESHAAFLLAKEIAGAYLGGAGFSTLKGGVLVPAAIEVERVELAELLGVAGVDEALREWPSGEFSLTQAMRGLERLAEQRTVIFWVDHLESPALTPRHPLDLDGLLWAVREALQRVPRLSVVLSGRSAFEGRLLGPEAAFHQQGQWLTMDYPPPNAWLEVAAALRLPQPLMAELATETGGHPSSTLLGLLRLMEMGEGTPAETMVDLATAQGDLAARAMQHARSLHRLGGQVLTQIALGLGPYAIAQRGASPPQEIRKVLSRLRLAGLIRHDDAWSVVNPLLAMAIRREGGPLLSAPDWELDPEPDD